MALRNLITSATTESSTRRSAVPGIFNNELSIVLEYDVEASMHRERWSLRRAPYSRKVQIEHFDGTNDPSAKDACLVALQDKTSQSHDASRTIGKGRRQRRF
jgi:hypothetical protein